MASYNLTGDKMRTPYGLEIIESCLICPLRQDRIFCDLPLRLPLGSLCLAASQLRPKHLLHKVVSPDHSSHQAC